jgi:hypothetical protein
MRMFPKTGLYQDWTEIMSTIETSMYRIEQSIHDNYNICFGNVTFW